jgi:RND family efflux transporter MFP subunit
MMKKTTIQVMALALLVGCNPKQKQETLSGERVIPVTTVKVKKEKVAAELRYSGTIEAFQSISLTFETTGTVESVMVDAGDHVTKGQLLATLEKNDKQSMYNMTLAKYRQAKDAYDRLKSVYEKGSLPEIKWIEMETNLEQTKSSLEISKSTLDKCNMYAPVSGIIGSRNIEPGMSSLAIGSSPLQLVDIKSVYVKISVPENEVPKINKGMKAHFSVSALNDKGFEGEITNISPVADLISRTYEAKIKVENPELELKPGMVCDVKMEKTDEKEMVLIPYQSVSKDEENKPYVYVIDGEQNRVKKQTIKTGEYYGSDLEVLSGLTQGQVIVNAGKEKLSDNSLIVL